MAGVVKRRPGDMDRAGGEGLDGRSRSMSKSAISRDLEVSQGFDQKSAGQIADLLLGAKEAVEKAIDREERLHVTTLHSIRASYAKLISNTRAANEVRRAAVDRKWYQYNATKFLDHLEDGRGGVLRFTVDFNPFRQSGRG
ncbi:MAG: hypothetical protein ACRDYE_13345 [Acidimicrobiales bacterium]